MSALIPPTFESFGFRAGLDGDALWVAAPDVARILGHGQAKDMTRSLDDDEKGRRLVPTLGGAQETTTLTEAGLYTAIMQRQSGRIEDALVRERVRRFQRWVTHDVLPAIRRTGSYSTTPALTEDEIVHQALQITARKVEALTAEVATLTPKAEAFDGYIGAEGDYSANAAAKLLQRRGIDTGQNRLIDTLLHWGWYYRGEKNRLRAKQAQIDCGRLAETTSWYIDDKTGERRAGATQPRITPKGVEDIYKRLALAVAS